MISKKAMDRMDTKAQNILVQIARNETPKGSDQTYVLMLERLGFITIDKFHLDLTEKGIQYLNRMWKRTGKPVLD